MNRLWLILRTLLLIGTLCAAVFGGFAIYKDFPAGGILLQAVSIGYNCPAESTLELTDLTDFGMQFDSTTASRSSITLVVNGDTAGRQGCHVGMILPAGSRILTDGTSPTDKPVPIGGSFLYVSAEVPLEANTGSDTKPTIISASIPYRLRRDGWGRHSFGIELNNGFPIQGVGALSPFPEKSESGESAAAKLAVVLPPEESQVVRAVPSTSASDQVGELTWPVADAGAIYTATVENIRDRYWADHAIDLVTLALGALLGVLLTMQVGRRPGAPGSGVRHRVSGNDSESPPKTSPNVSGVLVAVVVVAALITRRRASTRAKR